MAFARPVLGTSEPRAMTGMIRWKGPEEIGLVKDIQDAWILWT